MLERPGSRWLLAGAGSLAVSWRERRPCLVTPKEGWWIHRYRSGAFAHPGFHGLTPDQMEAETLDTFCWQYPPGSGDVVVDAGAGIGEEALTFSRLVGRTGRVVALEAHPDTYARLRLTVELNGLANVETAQLAVADGPGELRIEAGTDDGHIRNALTDSADSFGVPADALDGIYEHYGLDRVDLLKINIEGAERLAIAGMTEALQKTRFIAISCHDFLLEYGAPADMATFALVKRFVEEQGFDVATRPEDPRPWIRYYVYGRKRP